MRYSSFDVTGYVINECVTICPACFKKLNFNEKESSPIFAETEADSACSCENCGNEIQTIVLD